MGLSSESQRLVESLREKVRETPSKNDGNKEPAPTPTIVKPIPKIKKRQAHSKKSLISQTSNERVPIIAEAPIVQEKKIEVNSKNQKPLTFSDYITLFLLALFVIACPRGAGAFLNFFMSIIIFCIVLYFYVSFILPILILTFVLKFLTRL